MSGKGDISVLTALPLVVDIRDTCTRNHSKKSPLVRWLLSLSDRFRASNPATARTAMGPKQSFKVRDRCANLGDRS